MARAVYIPTPHIPRLSLTASALIPPDQYGPSNHPTDLIRIQSLPSKGTIPRKWRWGVLWGRFQWCAWQNLCTMDVSKKPLSLFGE